MHAHTGAMTSTFTHCGAHIVAHTNTTVVVVVVATSSRPDEHNDIAALQPACACASTDGAGSALMLFRWHSFARWLVADLHHQGCTTHGRVTPFDLFVLRVHGHCGPWVRAHGPHRRVHQLALGLHIFHAELLHVLHSCHFERVMGVMVRRFREDLLRPVRPPASTPHNVQVCLCNKLGLLLTEVQATTPTTADSRGHSGSSDQEGWEIRAAWRSGEWVSSSHRIVRACIWRG